METITPLHRRRPLFWCGVLIGAVALVASASAAPWRARAPVARTLLNGYAAEPLASEALRPTERVFLEKASANNREQVHFSQLALSQAANSDVRSHAQHVLADQRSIGEALAALIRRKGALMATGNEPTAQAYQRLAEKAGPDFDREFIRAMAERHEAFISLFEHAAADSKDTDVRDMAAAQLPTLRAHRNSILELKKALD